MLHLFFLTAWLSTAIALPTPQMSNTPNLGNSGPVGGEPAPPTATVTGTSGSLYGGSDLLGGVAEPSPVQGGNSATVSNYELVPGQEADTDLGVYLDLDGTENPQPLRGGFGATDPGPRTYEYDILNP